MKKDILDKIDQTILKILQENAKTPLKEIANQVYLSTPAVSARIEKMEKDGIFEVLPKKEVSKLRKEYDKLNKCIYQSGSCTGR